MKRWNKEFLNELAVAPDYRSFIACFFDRNIKTRPQISYQSFADRAGFSSKSFLNDIVRAKKRITPQSIEKIEYGLRLTGNFKKYFRALVASEEDKFWSKIKEKNYYDKQVAKLKAKILKELKTSHSSSIGPSKLVEVYLEHNFIDIYSSLGNKETPRSLAQISHTSGLTENTVLPMLNKMIDVHLAAQDDNGYYYPISDTLQALELKDLEIFRQYYFRALEKMKKRFVHQAQSKESLFMFTTLSIKEDKMQEFRETIQKFCADASLDYEQPDGDRVIEMVVGISHKVRDLELNR